MAKAKDVRHLKDNGQKEVVKLLEGLTGSRSLWEIWQDFIVMAACSICNSVKHPFWDEREQMYLDRAKKYSKKELDTFAEIIGRIAIALDKNPEQDFLGELFMVLGLGNEWNGQFFTPYSVCRLMARLTILEGDNAKNQVKENGFASVHDCTCGAGALLIAEANELRFTANINYQQSALFVGQDIDQLAACMCYIQLSLLGCAGYICVGDTLKNPIITVDSKGLIPVDNGNIWYTPMFYSDVWAGRRMAAKMDVLLRGLFSDKAKTDTPVVDVESTAVKVTRTRKKVSKASV